LLQTYKKQLKENIYFKAYKKAFSLGRRTDKKTAKGKYSQNKV
jgi:hypothetical protein